MLINQSLVKSSEKKDFCPKRYYHEDVACDFPRQESKAMTAGKYFEYKAVGSLDRNGEAAEMEPLKNGQRSTAQIRIDYQAKKFPEFMAKNNIEIVGKNIPMQFNLFEEFKTTGIIDLEVRYNGLDYLADMKLTQNLHSDFGEFGWGNMNNIDKLQAYTYTLLKYHVTGKIYGWLYLVFDYKNPPEYRIIEVPNPLGHYQDVYRRFKETYIRMLGSEVKGYPQNPTDACAKCPVKTCKFNGTKHGNGLSTEELFGRDEVIREMENHRKGKIVESIAAKFALKHKEKAKKLVQEYEITY